MLEGLPHVQLVLNEVLSITAQESAESLKVTAQATYSSMKS